MRFRQVAAFALGFAAGTAVLALVLLASGNLYRPVAAKGEPRAAPAVVCPPAPASPARAPAKLPPPPEQRLPAPQPITPPAPVPPSLAPPHAPRKSLALAMPIAGLDPAKLTDTFHEMRDGHRHEALDIMAPRGTPVVAVDEGNVAKLFTSQRGGLTVYQFNDARDLCYYYAHLERYAKGLKEGTLLRRGEVLGYVDSTGDASPGAPHLHFAVFRLGPEREWWKGTPIDPLPLLQGRQP
jgi:peptidoglycan LD-endopeptidase LytH